MPRNLILLILPILLGTFAVSCNDHGQRLKNNINPISNEQNSTNDDTDQVETLEIPKRPNEAVVLQGGACGCKSGEPITLGNCVAKCQSVTNEATEWLYMDSLVKPEIELTDLKDLFGWCKKELIDPNTGEPVATNPSCVLEAKNEQGSVQQLNFSPVQGKTSFKVDVTQLAADQTYRLTVVETTSGARSTTTQIRKISNRPVDNISGPLSLMPVTQYTCMNISTATDQNDPSLIYYNDASRLYFYYIPETTPDAMPAGIKNLYCHDVRLNGVNDPGGDRLEQTPGVFTLWNKWDPRFYDIDGDGKMEIHNIIQRKVTEQGVTLSQTPEIFFKFKWFSAPSVQNNSDGTPEASNDSGAKASDEMGYYMSPWIDNTTFRAYCPKTQHYYSNNPLFKAMRDVVGVSTEALYVAKKEGLDCTFILLRENLAKRIWFYTENNQNIQPNDTTIVGKKVQFYWPADTNTPFLRKSHQSKFTIISATELKNLSSCGASSASTSDDNGNSQGNISQYPPHDKRIGCVPITSN